MIVITFSLFFLCVSSKNLPPDINKCSRTDPKLSDCLATNAVDAMLKHRLGNKDMGLVRLEPLLIKKLSFGENSSDTRISIAQEYENLNMYNATTGVIVASDVKLSGDNWYWRFKTKTPQIKMEADYKMSGQLLVFPINGHGKCTMELFDIDTDYDVKIDEVTKNGKKHLHVTDFVLKAKPKRGVFNFENIIDGNEALSREVGKTMNENFDIVYEDVGKYFDEGISLIWKDIINRVFARVSEDELFLP